MTLGEPRKLRRLNHTTMMLVVSGVNNLQAQFQQNRHIRMLMVDREITVGFHKLWTHPLILTFNNNQNDLTMEGGVNRLPKPMAGTDLVKKVGKVADGQLQLHQQVERTITTADHTIPTVDHTIRMAIMKKILQKRGQLKEIISMRRKISRPRVVASSSTSVQLKVRHSRTDRKL